MDPKQFQQLKRKWYKKLAATGFKDIEDEYGRLRSNNDAEYDDEWLRTADRKVKLGNSEGAYTPLVNKNARAEYYRLASQYIWTAKFLTRTHRRIWELHCEGTPLTVIAKQVKLARSTVQKRVEDMREEFFGMRTAGGK